MILPFYYVYPGFYLFIYSTVLLFLRVFAVCFFIKSIIGFDDNKYYKYVLVILLIVTSLNKALFYIDVINIISYLFVISSISYVVSVYLQKVESVPATIFMDYVQNFYVMLAMYVLLFFIKSINVVLGKFLMLFLLIFRTSFLFTYLNVLLQNLESDLLLMNQHLKNIVTSGVFFYLIYIYSYLFIIFD